MYYLMINHKLCFIQRTWTYCYKQTGLTFYYFRFFFPKSTVTLWPAACLVMLWNALWNSASNAGSSCPLKSKRGSMIRANCHRMYIFGISKYTSHSLVRKRKERTCVWKYLSCMTAKELFRFCVSCLWDQNHNNRLQVTWTSNKLPFSFGLIMQ